MRYLFSGVSGGFLAFALICIASVGLGWSGWFIRPISLSISPEQIVSVRATPFGSVNASWIFEVTTMSGQECPSARGDAIMQPVANDTVWLKIPASAQPCMMPGSVVHIAYTVEILGINLRPVHVTAIVGE